MTSFNIKSLVHDGKEFIFNVQGENHKYENNYFTVLIGKNGTGKSTIFSQICWLILEAEKENPNISSNKRRDKLRRTELNLDRNGKSGLIGGDTFHGKRDVLPAKVIATTITPFDKFPISLQNRSDSDYKSRYYYMGARSRMGSSSRTALVVKVIESLVYSSRKSASELSKISEVFRLLNLHPRISINYKIEIRKDYLDLLRFSPDDSFNKLINDAPISSWSKMRLMNSIQSDPDFENELVWALTTAFSSADDRIEVNLMNGDFIRGSIEVFEAISFLKKFGLVRYLDFILYKDDGSEINVREASSGEQSIILTFLGVASEIVDGSLILLDEPEISLHPEWQERFIPLLISTFSSFKGCHFIIATHSPLLLTEVSEIDGTIVQMESGRSYDMNDYTKRSADYLLAAVFRSPGFKNEYLGRQTLEIIRLIASNRFDSEDFRERWNFLSDIRNEISNEDPISDLIDSISELINQQK